MQQNLRKAAFPDIHNTILKQKTCALRVSMLSIASRMRHWRASSLSSMKYANCCLDRHCPLLYMPRFKIILCFAWLVQQLCVLPLG